MKLNSGSEKTGSNRDCSDVCIIMPSDGSVNPELEKFIVESVHNGAELIVEVQGGKVRYPNNPAREKYTNINITRNRARERALRTAKRKWFLYMDSDVVPPANAIEMFKWRSEARGHKVMGGWYPVRGDKGIQVSNRLLDGRFRIERKTRWVAGCQVGENVIHQLYSPRTYKDMKSQVAPLGCLWIDSDVSQEMRFLPGVDQTVKDAYTGQVMLAGDCVEFGLRLKNRYNLDVWMNPAVVCQHK